MAHGTLIAVPVTSAEPPLASQVESAIAAGADVVELRVDCIGDVAAIEALLRQPRRIPIILTIRSAAEGGQWDGDDAERIALIERLGLLMPGFVDIELATWSQSANLRQKVGLVGQTLDAAGVAAPNGSPIDRPKNVLILSYHNWQETPIELAPVLDELERTQAGVVKSVFRAEDALDALRVLAELRGRTGRRATIAISLGEAGLVSRVLARKFGAFLTFAALDASSASAPGQPPIRELIDRYRWHGINSRTRVFGVVGWPVTHSQSPCVHNAALAAQGIDAVYLPLPVRPEYQSFRAMADFVSTNPWLDVDGLSVTLPHKEHALRWLAERGHKVSALAERCGAVNTLIRTERGWRGDNTDAVGAVAALRTIPELRSSRAIGRRAHVLGAGGAARAVTAGLLDEGCDLTVYNRAPDRAARLAQALRCGHAAIDALRLAPGDILVNCTPIGMAPHGDASPIERGMLRSGIIVLDTVYVPEETRLLREARQAGATVISGVEMFLAQAAAQNNLWHGRRAPIEAMRRSMQVL